MTKKFCWPTTLFVMGNTIMKKFCYVSNLFMKNQLYSFTLLGTSKLGCNSRITSVRRNQSKIYCLWNKSWLLRVRKYSDASKYSNLIMNELIINVWYHIELPPVVGTPMMIPLQWGEFEIQSQLNNEPVGILLFQNFLWKRKHLEP